MSDPRNPDRDGVDDAVARLTAADPARVDDLDLDAVRREVDRRIADTPEVVRPAHRGPARWLQVAAVAATVAVVGAGAFVVGRQTGGADGITASTATTTSNQAAPEALLSSRAAATAVSPTTVAPGVPPAPGAGTASADTKARSMIAGPGRTVFLDGGLSTEGGTAEAYGFDPASVVDAATAERIAGALGVAGTAVPRYQSWAVGPEDGSAPTVSLAGDGVASVSYNDPQAYPVCDATGTVADGSPEVASCPEPTPIGGADAVTRATDTLRSIGVDPAGFTLASPDDQAGGGFRTVVATPVSDAADAGVRQWSFSFVGDRLASVYGQLAPTVSLGRYTVVSPAEAVARMNDNRFGATGGGVYPMDTVRSDPATDVPVDPSAEPTPPTAPAPGAAIAWPVTEVTLTSATLGLMSHYQDDGGVVLLPAYTMTDADGATWTVVTVADEQLAFTG